MLINIGWSPTGPYSGDNVVAVGLFWWMMDLPLVHYPIRRVALIEHNPAKDDAPRQDSTPVEAIFAVFGRSFLLVLQNMKNDTTFFSKCRMIAFETQKV